MNPKSLWIEIYPPDKQAKGAFDGGRITENKPIGFPQDGGPKVPYTGPLFYWAWATAEGYGKIGMHPHKAFEIMSYALKGEIGHYDTLGNRSRIQAGGAQVMQTGSGIMHEEETLGNRTELFQIWFEPDLAKTVQQPPAYREFKSEEFPLIKHNGVTTKMVLGEGSPIQFETEAEMRDTTLEKDTLLERDLKSGRTLALVVVEGQGRINYDGSSWKLQGQDFAVIHAQEDSTFTFQPEPPHSLRFVAIEVPATVSYPLNRD